MPERCRVCEDVSEFFGRATVLGTHDVAYFRCRGCGYVQTEEPYWLTESYSEAIRSTDVGFLERNALFAKHTKYLIWVFLENDRGRFLDFGGGYGLFTRMMRDMGFDFRHYDKHCRNLFAGDFEADMDDGSVYDLLTAFEVFEHLQNPRETAGRMLAKARNMIVSTQLLPEESPAPGAWWYYGTEHGQHVGFFTHRSLEILAEMHGRHLYSNGSNLHLFWECEIGWRRRYLFPKSRWVERFCRFFRRPSMVQNDYRIALERALRPKA